MGYAELLMMLRNIRKASFNDATRPGLNRADDKQIGGTLGKALDTMRPGIQNSRKASCNVGGGFPFILFILQLRWLAQSTICQSS